MSKFVVKNRKGGFTLIEIMIVVLIIAILLAIAIPNFMRARETSRAKACQTNLRQIQTAKEQWAMDEKKLGTDVATLDELKPYVKDWPLCPSTGTDSYSAGIQDVDTNPVCANNGAAQPGDYNYHGLDQTAAAAP